MSQNHCSETSGSMRAPLRCENGTTWVYGSSARRKPWLAQVLQDARRRLGRRQARVASPASAVMRASSPITLIASSPWRRPISKSAGSWAGVTLSAPVPNSGSTCSSATIGSSRPTSGSVTVLPIRSR